MKKILIILLLFSTVANAQNKKKQLQKNFDFPDSVTVKSPSLADSSHLAVPSMWIKQQLANVLPVISTGTYTPPLSGQSQSNVSSITSFTVNYLKVNDMVLIAGRFTVTATASGTVTTQTFEIPFASTFTAAQQLSGTMNCIDTGDAGIIEADTGAGNRAKFSFKANNTASHDYFFSGLYRLL